jgi:AcrR family transcriptional regulator
MNAVNAETRRLIRQKDARERIVERARDLILTQGYAAFSLRKLAAELGYSPGALYLYFRDREDLLCQVIDRSFDLLFAVLQESKTVADPIETLKRRLRAYVRFGFDYPDDYRIAFVLRSHVSGPAAKPLRPHAAYKVLVDAVSACIKSGRFNVQDLQLASQILWAGIHGITSLLVTMPSFPWVQRRRLVGQMIDTLVGGLAADRREE